MKVRPDLELLDRYVGFSAELVRLSSVGLGAIALYLKAALAENPSADVRTGWFNLLLGAAALLFALAVCCGLLHRYHATDGLASHIRALRLANRQEAGAAEQEREERNGRYKRAESWMVSSECALAAGALVAGVAFAVRFSTLETRWSTAVTAASIVVLGAAVIAGRRWRRAQA